MIITLILALSIEGIFTNAARFDDSPEPNVVHYTGDPSSHYLIRDLVDQKEPIRFDGGGSMILRRALYDEYCFPSLIKQNISYFYPRFEDCRHYIVQVSPDLFVVKKCPRNSLFDPTISTCIIFSKLKYIPYSCIQECPVNAYDKETDEFVPHVICSNYNSDGTMRKTMDCVPVFDDPIPKYLEGSREIQDSLPFESIEGTSTELGHDEHKNYSPKPMSRLYEPLLKDNLGQGRRVRLESESGPIKVLSNNRNSKTLKSDPQHKSPTTKRSTRNSSIRKSIEKNDNLQKLVRGSGMNQEYGDELNHVLSP